ncbi:MAG TPA: hypothetical protein VG871_11025, partial [Vicinamibacterales bacterium]|nr:hypothetical protein [Vicinamibacterales bacterium]
MARKPAFLLAAVFVAGVGLSLLVYAPTYGFGFHYDDYYFLRPHARGDVAAAFSGPWYPPGVMAPFYRPLTVAFHALRFDWLQLD